MPRGVGIIGAGPGVSALHLPTLARLEEELAVVHIADAGSGRAVELAARVGARHSSGVAELLADPDVDVVAVCSPPEQHAAHVLAAVAAGAKAIFCEKPLALTDAESVAVIDACREARVVLAVGTNHLFDPGWTRTTHHLVAKGARIRTVSITAALPPNGRYHDLVTQHPPTSETRHPRPDWDDPRVAAGIVRRLIIGLGIHDLPIVRDLAPEIDRVLYAVPVPPIGYAVGFVAGHVLVQLSAVMLSGGADALWRLTIGTDGDEVEVAFRPSFVHDGGASVTVRGADGRTIEYPREVGDGYVAEWEALVELLNGDVPVEYGALLADARYAVTLADSAFDAIIASEAVRP